MGGGVSSVIRVDLEGPRPHHTNSSYDSVGYIPIIHIDFLFVFLPAPCHTHTHTLSVYQYHMVVFNCLLHDIRDYGLRFGIHNLWLHDLSVRRAAYDIFSRRADTPNICYKKYNGIWSRLTLSLWLSRKRVSCCDRFGNIRALPGLFSEKGFKPLYSDSAILMEPKWQYSHIWLAGRVNTWMLLLFLDCGKSHPYEEV